MNKEIRSIFGKRKVVLRGTGRAVTPYGGISVFVDFLNRIGYGEVAFKKITNERMTHR